MTEFIVKRNHGGGIELGIAVPGFNGSKCSVADKYWFSLTPEEVSVLMEKIRVLLEGR